MSTRVGFFFRLHLPIIDESLSASQVFDDAPALGL